MMGAVTGPQKSGFLYDVPHDPADFGRCHRLLQLMPEWRAQLHKVAEVFPKWKPLVDAWNELEALWLKEKPSGRCPLLYERMHVLEEEGVLLDGWKKTGPGSWERQE